MVQIAVVSITLSVAVMIIAMAIVGGFRTELTEKISGFTSELVLTERSETNPSLIIPFTLPEVDIERISSLYGVTSIDGYATIRALLQTDNGVEGIAMKGVGTSYDLSFIKKHITDGEMPVYTDTTRSREVVVSAEISRKMGLAVGDIFNLIVINENPRRDRFRVAAIYNTGLSEFDSKMVFGDIRTVRKINNWDDQAVEGYEFRTDGTDQVAESVFDALPSGRWNLNTIDDNYVQFFDWIRMMELNTSLVLIIMLIVAVINMLSGVLVIVLESVRMVGVLKTQGITFGALQRIFIYRSGYIVLRGLFWGNVIGLALCLVQYYFGLLTLDADAYLLSQVPIDVSILDLLLINISSFLIITLLMVVPTLIVGRIDPSESVKYS